MSQLAAFRALQREISQLEEKQLRMQNSESLTREIEFEEKLGALVSEYGMTSTQVLKILEPDELTPASQVVNRARKPHQVKVYTNPHNGEVIETKGGNHKGLKNWKQMYGADVVETWLA
jgi:hypothetical protein